jgi:hypothetical protein
VESNSDFSRQRWSAVLRDFLPASSNELIATWIVAHKIDFRIVKPRKTKLGDYRVPLKKNDRHIITVNSSLNPYSFLVTTIHEFAHFHTFSQFERKVNPHGPEWKKIYAEMLLPFVYDDIFPGDLRYGLIKHIKTPSASSCSDTRLLRLLKNYDSSKPTMTEDLPEGALFLLQGRTFIKGKLARKRYLCKEEPGGRLFRIHPLAEVTLVEN